MANSERANLQAVLDGLQNLASTVRGAAPAHQREALGESGVFGESVSPRGRMNPEHTQPGVKVTHLDSQTHPSGNPVYEPQTRVGLWTVFHGLRFFLPSLER